MTRALLAVFVFLLKTASSPPLAHRAVGQVLPAAVGPIQELHFAKPFRYVGGQPRSGVSIGFSSRSSCPAEVRATTIHRTSRCRSTAWLFWRNARRWDAPPEPASDRAAMYAFLEKQGYRMPDGAMRIRLVHVPESNRREELMIIYAGAPEPGGSAPPSELDVQQRALEGLRVVAMAP